MHRKRLTLVLYAGFPTDSVTPGRFSFRLSVSEEALEGDSSSLSPLSSSAFTWDLRECTLSLISHSWVLSSSWLSSWERHMTVIIFLVFTDNHMCFRNGSSSNKQNKYVYLQQNYYSKQMWCVTVPFPVCTLSLRQSSSWEMVLSCSCSVLACLWFSCVVFPQSAGPFGAVHALETSSS